LIEFRIVNLILKFSDPVTEGNIITLRLNNMTILIGDLHAAIILRRILVPSVIFLSAD